QCAGCGRLGLGGKVVTPEEVQANVLEHQLPEGNGRCRVAGGVRGDRAPQLQQPLVGRDVRVERDLDDVIDPAGRVGAAEFDDLARPAAAGDDDTVSAGPPGDGLVTLGAHHRDHEGTGVPGEGDGTLSDGPGAPLHEDGAAVHGPGHVDGAVRRDAGDAQA